MKHFQEITSCPESFSGTTALSRIVDGLGFKYYWGTDGLTEADLAYAPGNDSRNLLQTLDHLYYMTTFVCNTLEGKVTPFPENASGMAFHQLREATLTKLDIIKQLLINTSDQDFAEKMIQLTVNGDAMEFDIWRILSGPIVDIASHTGQIISFRRTNGNPIDPAVEPFMGQRMQAV